MKQIEPVETFLHAYWSGNLPATLAACTEDFVWLNTALPKQRWRALSRRRRSCSSDNESTECA